MTQEQKDLLLQDLCARLPYGVKVQFGYTITSPAILKGINKDFIECDIAVCELEDIKPYLFPLSSMTEEQKEELEDMNLSFDGSVINNIIECLGNHRQFVTHFDCSALIDWCNKNHFDYRGLIPMGLANDATGLNIY